MRLHALLMPLFSIALVTSGAAQDPAAESTDAAVAEIKRLFAATFEAYKKGDPAAVGALAVDDVDFVTSNAIWWRGREEVQKGLAVVLPSFGQITAEMWPRVEKVRFMTHDIAVVHDGGGRGGARATQVVARDAGQWRLVAQHGTRAVATPEFGLPGIRSLAADQPTLVSTWSAQSQPTESLEEDETAIRGLVAASTEAFNNKESSAYAARFVEDADFVAANAYWWRGREEIEKGIQVVLNGPLPSKHVSEQVEKSAF